MTTLYAFGISHYCEKARWALDYLGISYQLKLVAPGYHLRVAKKLGAKMSSVPILTVGEQIIQGSTAIIEWAESQSSDKSLFPAASTAASGADSEERLTIVKRLDDRIGVHIRRYYYSEALIEQPAEVLPIFLAGLPLRQKLLLHLAWPKVRKIMISRMDLGKEQGQESREIMASELDWLDGLLQAKAEHIGGDELSVADITAASLLAPLVTPAQHPTYKDLVLPPRLNEEIQAWLQRPSIALTRRLYEEYR